ncbi:MAG TPA: hypothetical protein VFE15_10440 [Marmoricola sp.]|jgi:hypothetical protein|nr:hypothetical protein [Marmoricola sp.]
MAIDAILAERDISNREMDLAYMDKAITKLTKHLARLGARVVLLEDRANDDEDEIARLRLAVELLQGEVSRLRRRPALTSEGLG